MAIDDGVGVGFFPEQDWLKVGSGEKTGFFAEFPIPGTSITRKYDAGDTFWNLSDVEKDKKARQDTLNELGYVYSSAVSEQPATREYVLRAMARNYKPGNSWDHLDAEACIQAADEIAKLRLERDEARQLITDTAAQPSAETSLDWLRWGLEEICRCTDMRAGNGDSFIFGIAMEALRSAGFPNGTAGVQKPSSPVTRSDDRS